MDAITRSPHAVTSCFSKPATAIPAAGRELPTSGCTNRVTTIMTRPVALDADLPRGAPPRLTLVSERFRLPRHGRCLAFPSAAACETRCETAPPIEHRRPWGKPPGQPPPNSTQLYGCRKASPRTARGKRARVRDAFEHPNSVAGACRAALAAALVRQIRWVRGRHAIALRTLRTEMIDSRNDRAPESRLISPVVTAFAPDTPVESQGFRHAPGTADDRAHNPPAAWASTE